MKYVFRGCIVHLVLRQLPRRYAILPRRSTTLPRRYATFLFSKSPPGRRHSPRGDGNFFLWWSTGGSGVSPGGHSGVTPLHILLNTGPTPHFHISPLFTPDLRQNLGLHHKKCERKCRTVVEKYTTHKFNSNMK